MNDPKFLRVETLFRPSSALAAASPWSRPRTSCAACWARASTLAPGKACSFSSEKSDKANLAENGIEEVNALVGLPVPDVYSAGLSEFVFAAGVKLMERDRPEIMYLSTTDYIQHKHAPGTPVANEFYADDGQLHGQARRARLHHRAHRRPRHERQVRHGRPTRRDLPAGSVRRMGRRQRPRRQVILPITDPYVVHHGALGSYAVVYLRRSRGMDRQAEGDARHRDGTRQGRRCRALPACRRSGWATSSSSRPSTRCSAPRRRRHDLSGLAEPLRSHGGISEQSVPLICNARMTAPAGSRHWRNFDAFDLALNLVATDMDTMIRGDVRHEHLRIAGKKVDTGARLEVRFPWDNRLVGTVPRATPELVAEAFRIAHDYKPRLDAATSARRSCSRRPSLLVSRKEELSRLITLEFRPLPQGLALRGRPRLRRVHLRGPALPARRRPDLLLRPHPARQAAQDLHPAPAAERHLGDHAVQSSAQHGGAQAGPGLRHQQLRGAEADRADAAHRARSSPTRSTRPACRARCCRSSPAIRPTSAMP